jgi:hypothetical protein
VEAADRGLALGCALTLRPQGIILAMYLPAIDASGFLEAYGEATDRYTPGYCTECAGWLCCFTYIIPLLFQRLVR